MKTLLLVLALIAQTFLLAAQCDCPALQDDITGKTVVNVSTVGELQAALIACNNDNGNYTILLEDGLYQLEDDLLFIGSNMVNLSIRSTSGDRDAVELRGKGPNGAVQYIFNVAADNFTLADVTIGNVMYHGVQIHGELDADSCLIQNVRFEDINQQFFKVSAGGSSTSDFGVVQCCWFEFTEGIGYQYYTGGIDAHASTNWLIRYNTFKHLRSPEAALSEHAIHFWNSSADNIIENNLIIDCDRGIGFGLNSSPAFGGIIRNNFVHTSRDVGIGLETCPNTKVYHNTVVTENYFNSIEYRFAQTENVHIANNITTQNIASRNGGTGLIESNYTTSDLSIFQAPQQYDYHLTEMSPVTVIDAGINLSDAGIDIDCEDRLAGAAPDLGADEYQLVVSVKKEHDEVSLSVYPNPTTGLIYLAGKPKSYQYSIANKLGKVIWARQSHSDNVQIDISSSPAGFYFLMLQDDKGRIIGCEKFIKI